MKAVSCATLTLLAACSWSAARPIPAPSGSPLIESRGVVMPLAQARRKIAFAPVVPRGELQSVAVIPPLGNVRSRSTDGVAIEYETGGARFLLSQWPRAGLKIQVAGVDVVHRPCAPVAYKTDGLLWATRNGLVMTLQPDGAVRDSLLRSQARRLLAGGRCPRARILRSARARLSRVVSWPRQSAS